MEAKLTRGKKRFFGTKKRKLAQAGWPKHLAQTGWYRRLSGPISPLSLLSSD